MRIKQIFLTLFTCLLVMGCGAGASDTAGQQNTVTELELWHYWDLQSSRSVLQKLVNEFNESHETINIQIRYIPDEDFRKQLSLSIADGEAPDLAIVDSSDFNFVNHMSEFVDLTETIEDKDRYWKIARDSCTVDGVMRGLPIGLNCLGFYYNRTLLAQAGLDVPETWEEFYQAAVVLSENGRYGCAMPMLQSEESMYSFLPVLWSQGGSLNDVASEQSRAVFHYLNQLILSGAMSSDVTGMSGKDICREFGEGKVAMMLVATTCDMELRELYPNLDYAVTKMPEGNGGSVSIVGGEVIGAFQGKNRNEALEFIRFLADKDRMLEYSNAQGMIAARFDVADRQLENETWAPNHMEIFRTARSREFSIEWPRISVAVLDCVGEILVGADEEQAASRLAQVLNRIRGDIP